MRLLKLLTSVAASTAQATRMVERREMGLAGLNAARCPATLPAAARWLLPAANDRIAVDYPILTRRTRDALEREIGAEKRAHARWVKEQEISCQQAVPCYQKVRW